MSSRYDQMGQKLSNKLNDLETTSQNLTRKFEALKRQQTSKDEPSAMLTLEQPTTAPETQT
jgi:hypothetical protein